MKRIYKLSLLLSVAVAMTGCGDFLERSSQNLIVPETVTHYKELLQGDAYFKDLYNQTCWTQLMTDDVEFQEAYSRFSRYTSLSSNIAYYGDVYTWQQEIENENFTDGAYLYLYKQIKVANLCIEGVESVSGTEDEREIVLGQAYFTRAMGYFYLANLYAQAYNEASPTDLCVPLVLTGSVTDGLPVRATVAEVWGQMVSDITKSLDYLKDKNTGDFYTIGYKASLVLATRIYLFMEDWDNAIKCGEALLELQSDLQDITAETKAASGYTPTTSDAVKNFFRVSNPEIIWNFNSIPSLASSGYTFYSLLNIYGGGYGGYWLAVASQSSYPDQKTLVEMYDTNETSKTGDRRLLYWFFLPSKRTSTTYISSYNSYRTLKYDKTDGDTQMLIQCLRTGEVYVSLAEAYARRNASGDKEQSISCLNLLREKRISPYTELTAADFATNEELVQFCWDERRRELCFEECHRWWDMRREGQKKVSHRYNYGGTSGNTFMTFTLKEKDAGFVLNFPQAERSLEPGMATNARPQRNED